MDTANLGRENSLVFGKPCKKNTSTSELASSNAKAFMGSFESTFKGFTSISDVCVNRVADIAPYNRQRTIQNVVSKSYPLCHAKYVAVLQLKSAVNITMDSIGCFIKCDGITIIKTY